MRLAGVVCDLPVVPILPNFAKGFLDLWHILLRQGCLPASISHHVSDLLDEQYCSGYS